MDLTSSQRALFALRNKHRHGRALDFVEALHQIGRGNVMAVSGGTWATIHDQTDNETIGLFFPCGDNRAVEVILNGSDYYDVRRVRLVVSGEFRGSAVVETESIDIDCEEVANAVYRASCWK